MLSAVGVQFRFLIRMKEHAVSLEVFTKFIAQVMVRTET
jgi:hypothetical protein